MTFDPSLNLEREAVYLKGCTLPSFRVWRSTDSVVLGRFLEPGNEVRLDRARELNVPVLRRTTGGGAVFHDLGNINYSIYLPIGCIATFNIEESLRALSFPVTDTLDLLGVPWSWEPPNNVYVGGRKISGSAQARSGGRLLHHGTLLVDTDLNRMSLLLKEGGRSCVAPVTNLKEWAPGIDAGQAADLLLKVVTGDFATPGGALAAAHSS
ncbi:MAG TPA: lipoate--protein ligase family protein [Candidatus Anoxymicrobiaceae bacterium]